MKLWFARRAVVALNYSWNIIRHDLTTASAAAKLHNKRIEHEIETCKREKKKKWTTKPRESSEGRIWGGDQSSRLAANDLHLSVCCSYEKSDEKTLVCLLLDTSKEILNSRWSMFGSGCFQEDEWKSSVACVDCPSHSHRGLGLTEIDMLHSADPFPAQKPQDCIVVGGGNHVQELQGGDIEKEVRGGESKRDEHVFLLTRYLWVGVWEIFFGGFCCQPIANKFSGILFVVKTDSDGVLVTADNPTYFAMKRVW